MEIDELNDEQLTDKIETFKDRLETMQEYISGTEDSYTRSNMQVQLQQYKSSLISLQNEERLRRNPNYSKIDSTEDQSKFDEIKKETLDKLNVKNYTEKYLYIDFNKTKNLNQFANVIRLQSRHLNVIGLINEDFLNQIPEKTLIENKIFVNKENIIEEKGISIFLNSKSKHKNKSESYHYGKCISEHYNECKSYHHNTSDSKHWNETISIHYDESTAIHHDKEPSLHYGNKMFN